MNALEKQKYDLFPEIRDWTADYDEHRHRKDWWNMPMRYYLVFNKMAWRLAWYGMQIGTLLIFAFLSWYSFTRFEGWWFILPLAGTGYQAGKVHKYINEWGWRKDMTFYDLFFREGYVVGDNPNDKKVTS